MDNPNIKLIVRFWLGILLGVVIWKLYAMLVPEYSNFVIELAELEDGGRRLNAILFSIILIFDVCRSIRKKQWVHLLYSAATLMGQILVRVLLTICGLMLASGL